MSLNSMNPLIMPRGYSPQVNQQNTSVSPQEWEYVQMLRNSGWNTQQIPQPYNQQNQVQKSDPYIDFTNEFSACSAIVKNKILKDPEFQVAMEECDKKIQSMIEDMIRPQLMQTPDGRLSFEKMLAKFRDVKEKYLKEENENFEALQKVMQDEVVKNRIAELNQSKGGK